MCSRFRSIANIEALVKRYGINQLKNFEFNPNVAPTDSAPIIRSSKSEKYKLEIAKFGLIHPWAKDAKKAASFINARSETIEKLPAFRKAFAERRAVIPVLGFYEWKEEDGRKIPYMVHRKDNEIMSLAGIWEYTELNNEKIYSFSIITGPPSALTEPLHDRTPIILDDPQAWIKRGDKSFFKVPNDKEITISRKNAAMNNPRIKSIDLIDIALVD